MHARTRVAEPTLIFLVSSRHKAVFVFAAAATATAIAFKYQAASMSHNDVEQRTRKAPHGYVSVDRSGGGI